MIAEIDSVTVETIKEIVNRGNKAVIQRKKDGIIVMEEKRTIKYTSTPRRE